MRPNNNLFASILPNIGWSPSDSADPIRLVGVLGCADGHGATTVATQVAIETAAAFEVQTLLVDCDFGKCQLAGRFGLQESPGLAELADGLCPVESAVQATGFANLHLLSGGETFIQVRDQIDGIRRTIDELLNLFKLVICDLPATHASADSAFCLSSMQRVLMVVNPEMTNPIGLHSRRAWLAEHGIQIAGVVMNRTRTFGQMAQ